MWKIPSSRGQFHTKCMLIPNAYFPLQGLSVRHVVRGGNRMQHPAGDRRAGGSAWREPHTAGQPAGNAPEPDLQRERQPGAGEDQHHFTVSGEDWTGPRRGASEQRSQLHSLSVSLRVFLLTQLSVSRSSRWWWRCQHTWALWRQRSRSCALRCGGCARRTSGWGMSCPGPSSSYRSGNRKWLL